MQKKAPIQWTGAFEVVTVITTVTTEELPVVPGLPEQALPEKPEPECCSSYKPSFP